MLCEAACGIVVETEDGAVRALRGDADDVMSRGFVCPKVVGMKELHEDRDRLRAPLVRGADGELHEASWEEAFAAAARGLREVRARHGKDALAVYQGNPTAHNLGLLTVGQVVLRSLGTRNLFSASSTDQVPHMFAAEMMFGNGVLMPVPDLDRVEHLIVIGANPAVSNGSVMTAPDMKSRLAAIRARGGKVVVIDPRRTETAELADEHVFVRPGGDPFLLLGMLHVIAENGLARPARLGDRARGLERLLELGREQDLAICAARSGVAAETITRLATELARADRAAVYGRVGICHQEHGTLAAWLVYALSALTGNLDREGGLMFTTPAVEVHRLVRWLGFADSGRWRSRVRGLSEIGGELPIAALAEEIEAEGPGQIRALITSAGNPVLSAPNGRRIDRALEKLDFMVSVDGYLNETTRHADVILPPVSPLERGHFDVALNAFAVRNVAKYSPPVIPSDAPTDADILIELGLRLRLPDVGPLRHVRAGLAAVAKRVGPEGALDGLLRIGPYGALGGLFARRGARRSPIGLSLRTLAAHPHGLDLGPLAPRLFDVIETPDQRVELAPRRFVDEARAMVGEARRSGPAVATSLRLIGRRHLRSNNSWLHNAGALIKGPERCTLLMHPRDAAARALADGARVEVASRVGKVTVTLELCDAILPGVVSLPHGFGHDRPGVRMAIARRHAGASVNDLTDDLLLDRASGNAAFSNVDVEVRAAVEESVAPREGEPASA